MPSRSPGRRAADDVEVTAAHDPAWVRFVSEHPDATCFHQPGWLATLGHTYGFRCFVAVQRDASGALVAGIPLADVRRPTGARRWSCLPFSDECGPLTAPGVSAEAFLAGVDDLRRRHAVPHLEVRTTAAFPGGRSREVAFVHTLALHSRNGQDGAGYRPRASVRRHIANAYRSGVEVEIAGPHEEALHQEALDTYYRLHVMTRRRQGVPAQPRRYFRCLGEHMIAPRNGFVVIARHRGEPIAGAVYLLGGRTVTYKYGASDPRAWSVRPNHAVMGRAIEWAVERGYTTFDFGRTDLDNPGLVQFKDSWDAERRPLRYTSTDEHGYRSTSPLHALLTSFIRHSPPAVCRGLGELLYRYAA